MKRWFPVVGYAMRAVAGPATRVSLFDGMCYCTDVANAYVEMLKTTKEKFPAVEGWVNHDVVVLDYPQFTITKEVG